ARARLAPRAGIARAAPRPGSSRTLGVGRNRAGPGWTRRAAVVAIRLGDAGDGPAWRPGRDVRSTRAARVAADRTGAGRAHAPARQPALRPGQRQPAARREHCPGL